MKRLALFIAVALSGCYSAAPSAIAPVAAVTSVGSQKAFYAAFAANVRQGQFSDTDSLVRAFHIDREACGVPPDKSTMDTTFPEFAKNQPIDSALKASIATRLERLGQ